MDVGDWLRSLGLGQHEALFRENEIDAEVLPELTDADLEKIGVPLGHRKRLLKAIANLGAAEAPAKPTIAPPAASSRDVAERRPITVMFCDLVGSTSLAAKLDPEDWRNLVGSYLDAASAAVTSLGGHVLKKLGDGLMALFGYPQAQENDGERAVRAALAIQRALADLNARNAATGAPELSARIGLESGRVVVDSTGEVYGEAPNVAARVQSAAAPGEIWITRGVHRQIAGLFVAEDKGEHELKGVPEKTQLYRIVRASGGGRRGGSRAPTPLVGRAEELDLLARRWERARRGEGQLSLIVGEPGLGKSRLIEEFRARLAETPHTWVEWASSQLLQNTPLHPIAEWGRARFGGAEVAGEKRLAELEAALGSVGLDAGRICAAARAGDRRAAAARPRAETVARGIAQPPARGALGVGARRRPHPAAGARVRGPALGRSDLARRAAGAGRARRAGAAADHCDDAARIPPALEAALAPRRDLARAARRGRGRAHGRRDRDAPCVVEGRDRGRLRTQRRRAAVRRGSDAAAARARRTGRRAGDPADAATVARRPSRPARPRARDRADRRGARARLLARAAASCSRGR